MGRFYLGAVLVCLIGLLSSNSYADRVERSGPTPDNTEYEMGRKMYMDGTLPSGQSMTGMIQGDIEVSGDQVKCGACHRRSGMGSTEGQQVVPAVTGRILFKPLKLPTSKPPATPVLRLAYTRDTLKRAIRNGIDSNGNVLDPNMPRYPLDDANLDLLIDYMETLSAEHSPGVDQQDIHFATIVSDSVDAEKKKALIDVMQVFVEQKNVETRHETQRAENAPWHKEWIFKPYRKWVLHVWQLRGPRDTWSEQLAEYYAEKPVFAVLSGVVAGSWEPIHDFCQDNRIPCVFPTTDLPVISESDFYPIYMNRGMTLEGEGVASHIEDAGFSPTHVFQVLDTMQEKAKAAAEGLKTALQDQGDVTIDEVHMDTASEGRASLIIPEDAVLVVWGDDKLLDKVLAEIKDTQKIRRIYLSTTLYGDKGNNIPDELAEITYFINPQEMPNKLPRLILRSTGWLRAKRIYSPREKRIQANAYFALKVTGGALRVMRGYFYRDYFIERVENIIDNAPYTSVYPHIGLAPGQRFVSKGYYIAKPSKDNKSSLEDTTGWSIP
jgi:hypothetical protein